MGRAKQFMMLFLVFQLIAGGVLHAGMYVTEPEHTLEIHEPGAVGAEPCETAPVHDHHGANCGLCTHCVSAAPGAPALTLQPTAADHPSMAMTDPPQHNPDALFRPPRHLG